MDQLVRCSQCHTSIKPGVAVCDFCGHVLGEPLVTVVTRRTWQETAYLMSSIVMVLQGLMWLAVGVNIFLIGDRAWIPWGFFAAVGAIGIALGIALFRWLAWAQWFARAAGVIALLICGAAFIQTTTHIRESPYALCWSFFWTLWFLYWAFLEYLIWVVAD